MYASKRVSTIQTSMPATPAAIAAAAANPFSAQESTYTTSVWAGPEVSAAIPRGESIETMWVTEEEWNRPLPTASPPPATPAPALRELIVDSYRWQVKHSYHDWSTSVLAGLEASPEVIITTNDRIKYISVHEQEVRAQLLPAASLLPAGPVPSLHQRFLDEYNWQVEHGKPKAGKTKKHMKKKGED
ncbi:MAG: hypothetical protein LQ344_004206 [Seirophora lacunosa]|nr:MAG: hypothetical protein LQ344_004206 [Seirophora lacunosa]